ncbi:hypothetical protein HZC07_03690, partial [Candidatus Micrarchaeota archaeon]|nr:hypothetical protein [Candidatus Micrarchaeota archaeon]
MSEVYDHLNRQWKSTARLLLGGEVGELDEYRKWLIELNNPRFVKKSAVTGREMVFTSSEFDKNAKFTSMDEVDFNKKFEPLGINEMKDIDSLIDAVQERVYYCGNIVLGNSKFIQKSSNVSDSFYIYDSVKINNCKNLAYSQWLRLSENIFGTIDGGESKFCVRCSIIAKCVRSFELWNSGNCSDCYYSFGLENCADVFFCFNLVGKRQA